MDAQGSPPGTQGLLVSREFWGHPGGLHWGHYWGLRGITVGLQGSPLGKLVGLGETHGSPLETQESSLEMLGSQSGTGKT